MSPASVSAENMGTKGLGGTDRNENFVPVCPQNRKIEDKMNPLKTPVKWGFSDRLSPSSKYGDKWKMPEMPILSGFLSFCPQICPQKKKKSGDRKIRYPMGFSRAGTNSGTNSFKRLYINGFRHFPFVPVFSFVPKTGDK